MTRKQVEMTILCKFYASIFSKFFTSPVLSASMIMGPPLSLVSLHTLLIMIKLDKDLFHLCTGSLYLCTGSQWRQR